MPSAGEKIRASDIALFVRKTVTESVTSSTTLQDDDELTLAVEANTIYTVQGMLVYDAATAGDYKFQFAVPTSATLNAAANMIPTTATAATGNTTNNGQIIETSPVSVGGVGAGTIIAIPFWGVLDVDATAGNFKLQWAQNASSATATRMFSGSYISLQRVS